MYSFITTFNLVVFLLFTVFYFYQIVYTIVSLTCKSKAFVAEKNHKYGVIIAARNESAVIAQLIASIQKQKYPRELVDIFVIADNCTDNTADVAREAGATVFVRNNTELVGKGYALDYAFQILHTDYADRGYEGYFIFDADNLLDENYIKEMNSVFDAGYLMVTSYRNSKNYDSNWISAGSSLWFLRESRYLNNARMILGTSCAVSGTGFLVHDSVIRKNGGWKYHLLTEDIEFSVDNAIQGGMIGYCESAKLYDEQPVLFSQSWNQRLRWAKGFYQVFVNYGGDLVKTALKEHSFSCYDMFMTVTPAMFISLLSIIVNFVFMIIGIFNVGTLPRMIPHTVLSMVMSVVNFYLVLFVFGLITTITEWKQIHALTKKKILYTFTFPIFIFTYVPISIVALFRKIEWKPIHHNVTKTIEDIHE